MELKHLSDTVLTNTKHYDPYKSRIYCGDAARHWMRPGVPNKMVTWCVCSQRGPRTKIPTAMDTHRQKAWPNKGLDTAHFCRVRPPHMVWNVTDPSQAPNKNSDHWKKWTIDVVQYCRDHIFWFPYRALFVWLQPSEFEYYLEEYQKFQHVNCSRQNTCVRLWITLTNLNWI